MSKKTAITNFHKNQILDAAEELFSTKGYTQTTISDISIASEYSRRTLYSYFESKDDILYHIIERGLISLKNEIEIILSKNTPFLDSYKSICFAMIHYQTNYPYSSASVASANSDKFAITTLSDTVKHILLLGTEINACLADFITQAQNNELVRKDINPLLTVYILWSNITSFITLIQTKGGFISNQFSISEDELFNYGFQQIINSILINRL